MANGNECQLCHSTVQESLSEAYGWNVCDICRDTGAGNAIARQVTGFHLVMVQVQIANHLKDELRALRADVRAGACTQNSAACDPSQGALV